MAYMKSEDGARLDRFPVARKAPRLWLPIGDSIAYMDAGLLSESPSNLRDPATAYRVDGSKATGKYAWANFLLGHPFRFVGNAGVPGDTTAQILARLDAALELDSDIVSVCAGANDHGPTAGTIAVPAATTIANLYAIYDRVRADGKVLVIEPTGTRSVMTSTDSKLWIATVNRAIADYATTRPGVLFADTSSVITNPSTGVPYNSSPFPTSDGTHPNAYGAMRQGTVIAAAVSHLVKPVDLFSTNGNVDPLNYSRNASNLDSAGTVADGVTGTPGTYWAVGAVSGTAVAAVSKVARTDNKPGEWTRITIGPANTAEMYAQVSVRFDATGADGVKVGDRVLAAIEVRTSGLTDVSKMQGGVLASSPNGAFDLNGAWTLGNGNVADVSGVFVVEGWVIGAGATFLNLRTQFKAASGIIDFGRTALYKVTGS